jgi:hypothetical protein
MESHGPIASPSDTSTATVALRAFSKTIATTYVGLGLFGLTLLIVTLYKIIRALVSGLPFRVIPGVALVSLGIGFMYVIWALHQRRNWARYTAVSFWLLCLAWSAFAIVRNGLHPEPATGYFEYSNADQLAGARLAALAIPYVMAILESTAIYCLLRKVSVVNQFKSLGQTSSEILKDSGGGTTARPS